jgi:hypothetical protein
MPRPSRYAALDRRLLFVEGVLEQAADGPT